jgi:site-specific recombinase XerD
LNTKQRVSWAGEPVEYLACDSLQFYVTKLYRDAGIRGASCHGGRRTIALRLIQQAVGVEIVQLLLGRAELDHVRPYLQVAQKKLQEMFSSVL